MERTAAGHVEKLAAGAVDVVFEIKDAFVSAGGLEKDGAGAIAKKDAGGAVGVIKDGTHFVAADDEDLLVGPGANELRADRECIGKAGAGGGKVKAPGFFRADAILNKAGGGGKHHIRSNARNYDQFDLGGVGSGFGQEGFCSFRGEMGASRAIGGNVALADTGAGPNPFVICRDHFLEVGVGEHLRRNVRCDTRDFCRDAVGHDSPWAYCKSNECKILCDAYEKLQGERRRNQDPIIENRASNRNEGRHSPGGRISWRQVSFAVFWSMADTEQYFCSLSSMAR